MTKFNVSQNYYEMNYSEKIPNNQLYLFIKDYIDSLIASHRKTKWFQLETELFNDFDKKQILNNLARDKDEHNFFKEQFEYISKNDLNWNKDNSLDNPEIKFITKDEIIQNQLIHFRFSIPLISLKKDLIIMKVVFQNSFSSSINGSSCIELFKFTHLKKWENIGNLFGISI